MGNLCNSSVDKNNSKYCECFDSDCCQCNCCQENCGFCNCCDTSPKKIPMQRMNIVQIAPPTEKEIIMYKYASTHDLYFNDIEGKYNILTYIQLIDYINLLEYYSSDTATLEFNKSLKAQFSSKDPFLSEPISFDHFQSFIENKLFRIPEIYEMWGNNELSFNIFKTAFLEVYTSLQLKLNQKYESKNEDRIKKINLIPLGILFCVSNVVSKIKLIFDLFKNEKGLFAKSNELDEYLFCSFIISSYCLVSARKKVGVHFEKIPELNREDIIKLVEVSELKDSLNLVNVFNNSFFDKEELTWEEFRNKFENIDGFQWILSSKGTRKKLEENNV